MGVISVPTTFSPNTTISSSQINNNFTTIYNEFNGSIAAANLATNAVTTAKISDANVTTAKIADLNVTTGKIADAAVTPEKRSGGFKIGTIAGASVLNTTGNKAITGVGFTPKLVRFTILPTAATTSATMAVGAMTATSQYIMGASSSSSPAYAKNNSTSACLGWLTQGSTTFTLLASYVSMDADGFTINVSAASSTFDAAYEAYG